ncbi:heavy-metal-associated domain-containing protein [Nocardioides sp. NPDC057772]|uniref:heavy-metal-associated domain-containing protein n=1 Tax=Nocardioides sp. NPDC057772 TaxID=3346245 RepID=UPI00366F8682
MTEQISLRVSGISCAGCEQRARAVLRRMPGVVEAAADHDTGQVNVVVADGSRLDRAQVAARLSAAGFDPVGEVAP